MPQALDSIEQAALRCHYCAGSLTHTLNWEPMLYITMRGVYIHTGVCLECIGALDMIHAEVTADINRRTTD